MPKFTRPSSSYRAISLNPIDVYHSSARATSGTMIIGTPFLTESAILAMPALKLGGAIAVGGFAPAACRRLIASRSPRSIATASAV